MIDLRKGSNVNNSSILSDWEKHFIDRDKMQQDRVNRISHKLKFRVDRLKFNGGKCVFYFYQDRLNKDTCKFEEVVSTQVLHINVSSIRDLNIYQIVKLYDDICLDLGANRFEISTY